MQEALGAFQLIETDASHVRRAKQVQRLLATRSQRGRKIPGLLMAAAAEGASLAVIHYDADFDRIATVAGQSCAYGARRKYRLISRTQFVQPVRIASRLDYFYDTPT